MKKLSGITRQCLGKSVVSYTLGSDSSYRRGARIKFRRGSFDRKLRVLVQILKVKRDRKTPMPFFSTNTSDKNFEIDIL